jgi:hypothetical protein
MGAGTKQKGERGPAKMKQGASRQLYGYWNGLRGERAYPDRSEIDPAAIRGLLNDTFMLEAGPDRDYRVVVGGARLGAVFLVEVKGLPLVSLFREEDRETLRALLESVHDDPTPVVAGLACAPAGRDPMEMEFLALPLGGKGLANRRILALMAPASTPAWAGLVASEPICLTSLRILHVPTVANLARPPLDPDLWTTLPLASPRQGNGPRRTANLTLYSG